MEKEKQKDQLIFPKVRTTKQMMEKQKAKAEDRQ